MAKILLVEDDKSLREIYGVRLMAEGYTITSAGDGEEALAVAIKERPDLIVSDVMMPKISGFDMLDILRSTTETKNIKVIMMTALSSEDQRARGEALGADRYLVKSQVGIEDVVRTVHEVLGDSLPGATPATQAPAPAVAAPTPVLAPVEMPAPQVAAPAPVDYAAPAPVAPIADVLPPAPVAAPVFEQPAVAPAPQPTTPDFTAPAPAPIADVVPVAAPVAPAFTPTPAPAPQPAVTLPAPTAPFSSDPPASMADRMINPLPSATDLAPTGIVDIAAQMNQELNAHLAQQAAAQAPQPPVAQPIADITPAPQAQPQQYAVPPQQPQPPVTPLPPQPGV